MKDKILILGYNSNLGRKFINKFSNIFEMHLFNRNTISEIICQHKIINGNPLHIHKNPSLDNDYLYIINFIFLRNQSVKNNLSYCNSLLNLCRSQKKLKKLIHISSTMVSGFGKIKINVNYPKVPINKLYGYSLIKSQTEIFLSKNYINTYIVRFGLIQNDIDFDFILKKITNNLFFFKGTRFRNIPMTKEITAINTINKLIHSNKKNKLFIKIDYQYNLEKISSVIEKRIIFIPNFLLKLFLVFTIIFKLKSFEFRLRNLDNKINYENC